MRGRLYDARIGRFMQADPPFMESPGWSQGLNRYSYVFNTPLNAVDPSGFNAEDEDDEGVYGSIGDDGALVLHCPDCGNDDAGGGDAPQANEEGETSPSESESCDHCDSPIGESAEDVGDDSYGGIDDAFGGSGETPRSDRGGGAAPTPLLATAPGGPNDPKEGGHTSNQRESNREKHEKGDTRRGRDQGKEKGDRNRSKHRKRPPDHRGPWPKPMKMIQVMPMQVPVGVPVQIAPPTSPVPFSDLPTNIDIDWTPVIGWSLVAAGGAVIVATVVEDVLTFGAGIADDPATLTAGGALITQGLNYAP